MFKNKKLTAYSLLFFIILLITYLLFPAKHMNSQTTPIIEKGDIQKPPEIKVESLPEKHENIQTSALPISANSLGSDYIVDCSEQSENPEQGEDNTSQQFSDYLLTLSQSAKSEDKLAQLIQSSKEENKNSLTAYSDLFNQDPSNKLLYSRILKLCISQFDGSVCNEGLYGQAFQIDEDNAMLWHSIAALKLKQEDISGAISALNEANKKNVYDNYYTASVSFIEENLHLNSALNFQQRFVIATGIGAAKFSSLSPIMDFCEKNDFTQTEITDVCYQTAKQLEHQSNTEITELIALTLQESYHEYYQNNKEIENISKKVETLMSLVKSDNYQKTLMLLPFDQQLAKSWLELSLNSSEKNIVKHLIQDAIFYSRDPNYNPCPSISPAPQ